MANTVWKTAAYFLNANLTFGLTRTSIGEGRNFIDFFNGGDFFAKPIVDGGFGLRNVGANGVCFSQILALATILTVREKKLLNIGGLT